MEANLNEQDSAILQSIAVWVGMAPGDFLRLGGLILADALSGLYAAMARDPDRLRISYRRSNGR